MVDGLLHPLVDWCPGGFLCAMPVGRTLPLGTQLDVRLIVSSDGVTVSDFDISAELLRFNEPDGTVAARIDTLHGVAAARFEAFFNECRQSVGRPDDEDKGGVG